jgi:hypothetical protein
MKLTELLNEVGFKDYKPTAAELDKEIADYTRARDNAKPGPMKAKHQLRINTATKKKAELKD